MYNIWFGASLSLLRVWFFFRFRYPLRLLRWGRQQHFNFFDVRFPVIARRYNLTLRLLYLRLQWQSAAVGGQAKPKNASKTKFTCPECGQNAWAKPDAQLGCYDCYEDTEELILMLAETSNN